MQTIYLDISNKGVIPTVFAKQGDVGRKFEVVLTDSGLPYIPAGGYAFSVWYSGVSGEGNYTDVGESSAFSVDANKVTVELITQMLAVAGEGSLCLVLNGADGSQIASWNINYAVESIPGVDSEEAKNYYTAFSNAVQNLPYPDSSLSVVGKAADSAAVGVALAGKAPAGYGLGDVAYHLPEVTDANTATNNGWYLLGKNAANGFGYKGVMRVDAYSSSQLMQTLYTQGYSSKLPIVVQRTCVEGNWSEWAFLNPVVGDGGEYRTTELHEGKPVYTQLFNLGAVTASGEVTVSIPGLSYGIRYAGRIGAAPLPILSTTALYIDTYSDGATIGWVCGHSDWIGRTVYCQLWYVKD